MNRCWRHRLFPKALGWGVVFGWLACLGVTGADLVREPNTTLRLPQVPGSFGYRFAEGLGLSFEAPVAVATPPGETNRLFIVEQRGRISVITNLAAPTRTVFLDLVNRTVYGGEQGLLGLAFHPQYAQNGRFFVFRTCMARTGTQTSDRLHDRLSEFRVSDANPNRADTTERILFQQSDDAGNHNGGDLHFGPDGFLYVAVGDEGNANDSLNNSQTLTKDFFAGILRLDVDGRPGSLAPNPHPAVVAGSYWIPGDNPFVGATNFLGRAVDPSRVRTEYWSVGLRNPWRMSFDRATGELWVGDVGQGAWESVTVSRRGGNHGWAFREASAVGPKGGEPVGFTTDPRFNYVRPVYAYPHGSGSFRGNSITGGVVYRGSRLSALYGWYVFADYVTGNVWALQRREGQSPAVIRLTGQNGISGFGVDPRNGDVLACSLSTGRILRLQYSPDFSGTPIPESLADTGAFADLASLTPHPGIVPYAINLPFWSDGARKRRWFSVPDPNLYLGLDDPLPLGTPAGSVFVKHFDIEKTNGVPESVRRLETRFLVRNASGVYGVTYRWDSPSGATLVPEEGFEEVLDRTVDGVPVSQTWRYPGRAECLACHTPQAGHTLSFLPSQLHPAPGRTAAGHDLQALARAGYFPPGTVLPGRMKTLVAPDDAEASLEWRARSWLAVNCSSCHRSGGTGGGFFDLRLSTPTEDAGIIQGPLSDSRGDDGNRVVVPGDPEHSMLWQRLRMRGPGQMPPLGSAVADPAGVDLIRRWIESLSPSPTPESPELVAELQDGRLRLRVRQPANQAIELERAADLESGRWSPVVLPGTEPEFPATARERILEPAPEASSYFRVRGTGP